MHKDVPGGPVVKNPPCNPRDAGSIPGQETKTPHDTGQVSPCTATTQPGQEAPHPNKGPCMGHEDPTGHSQDPGAGTSEAPHPNKGPCVRHKKPTATAKTQEPGLERPRTPTKGPAWGTKTPWPQLRPRSQD